MPRYGRVVFVILILAVCVLSVYICADCRADAAAEASGRYLHETLFLTDTRRLRVALAEGDAISSYHYAANAADNASAAGLCEEALFLRRLSSVIRDASAELSVLSDSVGEYLDSGAIPSSFATDVETTEEAAEEVEPTSVSSFRRWAAGVTADEVIGIEGVLHPIERSRGGFLFTCRNAYVVIDTRRGYPREVGISLPPCADSASRLSREESIGIATEFLREFYPPDIYRSAVLTSVEANDRLCAYELVYESGERMIHLTVRRDLSRVVRCLVGGLRPQT